MNWTKEQQEAIELKGKNILVAAAAGSGKTAVLVERIKRLILEEKCSVENMLIVTFTNAAAAEMKEKIRTAISRTLAEFAEKGDREEDMRFLKKQLDNLSSANISTFHSFALDVIRRYFYIIQIEPDFKICDNTQEALLKGDALEQLVEECFEEGSPEFYHFLKCYSGDRDERKFKEIIAKCYNTIRSLPEPFEWLEESILQLKDGEGLDNGPAGKQLFRIAEEKVEEARVCAASNKDIARLYELGALTDLCEKDLQQFELLSAALSTGVYETFRDAANLFKLPTMSSKIFASCEDPDTVKAMVSDNRNAAKKLVKELKDIYFSGDFAELKREMARTYDSARFLQKLLIRYDELYRDKKRAKNLADFGDIEHYAYQILKDDEAAAFYRSKFTHIFIDEYQDSNVIQEALIDQIKRENNLFMVGDVKQSIYKFRLAEPEIFQTKYKNYAEGKVTDSVKIDLNKNFRSKAPVIDFINDVCRKIMDGYDENAALYMGDVHGHKAYDSPKLYLTQVPWTEDADMDDELKNIIKAEKEALAAAAIIRENLGQPIFDSKREVERPLEKKDIVILMRGVKNYGDVFYKVLTDNNVPAYVDDNDGFFDTMEINAFLSALYIIDNPKQDVPLLTLLRSEMMDFSIEEMVQIRTPQKKGSYYDAFVKYSEEGEDEALKGKCAKALATIEEWRSLSKIMPLDKLIWRLLMDTGFYIAMGAMPGGSQRQANLRALTDKALSYQKNIGGSLYGFISYIEAIKDKKVAMGQVKLLGENDDLVRIMTVHKSKGLEFPMVLLAGFCRRLNYDSVGKVPVMHKDLGIGFPIVDPANRWYKVTLLQNMIKDRFHKEAVDEEKRILYVALTRAKDKLKILGIVNDYQKEVNDVMTQSPKDSSYFTMSGKVICKDLKAVSPVSDAKLVNLSTGIRRNVQKVIEYVENITDEGFVSPEIRRLMEFEYPYAQDLLTKSKYSVSQLNSAGHVPVESLEKPIFTAADTKVNASARGTIYHSVLEHLDVKRAIAEGIGYISGLIESMVTEEILLPEEAEIIDIYNIESFVKSPLVARMAQSNHIEKERHFTSKATHEGKEILVQGTIDCFFEEEDGLVLIDYKTGNLREARTNREDLIRARYQVQMDLYKDALQKATGKIVKETYLYLTDAGQVVKM